MPKPPKDPKERRSLLTGLLNPLNPHARGMSHGRKASRLAAYAEAGQITARMRRDQDEAHRMLEQGEAGEHPSLDELATLLRERAGK